MENNVFEIMKSAVINYVKERKEDIGKVMEIFNHIDEAIKISKSLPPQLNNELNQVAYNALMANGISSIFFNKR